MIDFGLDDPQVAEHYERALAIIDGPITELANRISAVVPSGSDTEMYRLHQEVSEGPLDVVTAILTALEAATGSLRQISFLVSHPVPTSPIVFQALLRTALVGSARVTYVLLPVDPDVRRDRAAAVLGQDTDSGIKALKQYTKFEGLAGFRAPEDLLTRFLEQRDALRHQQPQSRDGDVVTGMIGAVIDALHTAGVDDELGTQGLRDHAHWLWNTYSGLAHGYSWTHLLWGLSGDRRIPGDFPMDLFNVATCLQIALTAFHTRSTPGSARSTEPLSLRGSRRS